MLSSTPMNTLGERLFSSRKESGLSQKEAAARVGMTQGNLSKMENDLIEGSVHILRLANLYGVNPAWLETEKGERTAKITDPVLLRLIEIYKAVDPKNQKLMMLHGEMLKDTQDE